MIAHKLLPVLILSILPPGPQVDTRVVSVVDGDTIKVEAQVWPGWFWRGSVRLAGVDAPELRAQCREERRLALEALDFVEQQVGEVVTLVDVQRVVNLPGGSLPRSGLPTAGI